MPRPMQRSSKIWIWSVFGIRQTCSCTFLLIIDRSNLGDSTIDQLLKETFEKHGNIAEAVITRDSDTQRSRGFGYVVFEVKEEAWEAAAALKQGIPDGRTIFCKVGEEEVQYSGGYNPN
ncbi:hypothetical protein Q7P35_008800 [Cladosporium inversicolor]